MARRPAHRLSHELRNKVKAAKKRDEDALRKDIFGFWLHWTQASGPGQRQNSPVGAVG
jgi:hypothetical protein